jgi:hypothetical protein
VNRADVESYLHRDWRTVAAAKTRFWIERKAEMSPLELLAAVDRFRSSQRALRPDWPSEAERAADLEAHVRLSERLRRVGALAPR